MKVRQGFVSNSSTSSFVLIGISVSKNKLYTTEMMRTCKCDVEGIKDMDYCPKCGKHVFAEEEVPIPEIVDGNIEEYQIHDINDDMIISIPDTYATDDDYVMHQVKIPENINEIRENMKKTLEPLGLWDDDDFGVWSGLEGNY